jgi:hypothetical protein
MGAKSKKLVTLYSLYFFISIIVPIIFFLQVSQPEQKKNLSYANTSLRNVIPNLEYYSHGLISSKFTLGLLVLIFLVLLVNTPLKMLDLGFFGASGTVLFPVLIQSNQRVLNYLVVPILFLSLILARMMEHHLLQNPLRGWLVYSIIFLLPVSVFTSTKETRSWYVYPGLGSETRSLIMQVHGKVPQGSKLCVSFAMSKSDENFLIGGFSAGSAFAIAPNYSSDTLMDLYSNCKNDSSRYQILIEKNSLGKFEIVKN